MIDFHWCGHKSHISNASKGISGSNSKPLKAEPCLCPGLNVKHASFMETKNAFMETKKDEHDQSQCVWWNKISLSQGPIARLLIYIHYILRTLRMFPTMIQFFMLFHLLFAWLVTSHVSSTRLLNSLKTKSCNFVAFMKPTILLHFCSLQLEWHGKCICFHWR